MVENDTLSFLHRQDRPLRDREDIRNYLIGLVDELLEIEAETHPSAGSCPNKDDLSREATQVAGRFLEFSIGCSIDHQVGLVLNSAPSGAPPLFDDRAANAPSNANDHLHEATAAEYSHMDDDLKIDKRMLWSLLMLLPHSLITGKLWVRVLSELHSLDMAENSEFFAPTKLARGQRRSELNKPFFWLKALEHVEFLYGKGGGRGDAEEKVADEYVLKDTGTLKQWNNKLPKKHIDKKLFEAIKRRARNRGRGASLKNRPGDKTQVTKEAEALRIHGAAYRKLEGRPDW